MTDVLDVQDKQELNQDVPLLKEKKPRTAKQIESFEIARQKRAESIANKKQEKKIEASKLLLGLDQKKTPKPKPKPEPEPEPESESSSEEEIIIKKSSKAAKDKKKKKKKIIIVEESSESESDEYETPDEEPKPHKSRNFSIQQNKKSLIKINNQPLQEHIKQKQQTFNHKNYFLD
jgi:hypothetical protein